MEWGMLCPWGGHIRQFRKANSQEENRYEQKDARKPHTGYDPDPDAAYHAGGAGGTLFGLCIRPPAGDLFRQQPGYADRQPFPQFGRQRAGGPRRHGAHFLLWQGGLCRAGWPDPRGRCGPGGFDPLRYLCVPYGLRVRGPCQGARRYRCQRNRHQRRLGPGGAQRHRRVSEGRPAYADQRRRLQQQCSNR